MAAARKVSAAPRRTDLPSFLKRVASLAIVVVFPVPLTPTTRMTNGLERVVSIGDESRAGMRPRVSSRSTSETIHFRDPLGTDALFDPIDQRHRQFRADVRAEEPFIETIDRCLIDRKVGRHRF